MDRLFIGLTVDKNITEKLAPVFKQLSSCKNAVKAVSPHHLHITLKFLGSTDRETTSKILQLLPEAVKGHRPVGYRAEGLGAFPGLKKPAVLWCGITAGSTALLRLQRDIEGAMKTAGFEKEKRPFSPHITVGRLRKGRKLPPEIFNYFQQNSMTSFGSGIFNELILFKSDLTPEGPHYTELLTIRLK